MKTRFRFLAALLALFAFSASLAEAAWASACAPEVAAASTSHDGHGAVPGHEHERAPAPDGGSECPLHVAASAGCTVVLLPVAGEAVPLPDAGMRAAVPSSASEVPDLLLVSGPFRPPQR